MSGIAYTFSLNCDNQSLTQAQIDSLKEQSIWADVNGPPWRNSCFSVYKLSANSLQEAIDSTVENIRAAVPGIGQFDVNIQ